MFKFSTTQPVIAENNLLTLAHWSQKQREQLVRLLILTEYSDRYIRLEEQDNLDARLQPIHWEQGLSLSHFVSNNYAAMRDISRDPLRKAHCVSEAIAELHGVADEACSILQSLCTHEEPMTEHDQFLHQLMQRLQCRPD